MPPTLSQKVDRIQSYHSGYHEDAPSLDGQFEKGLDDPHYRKKYFFTRKGKNHIESISRRNCIFGGFSPGRWPSILSSQNALALHVLMHLERDG